MKPIIPGTGNTQSDLYTRYVTGRALTIRDSIIEEEKINLLNSMLESPDYQPNVRRNNELQGMLLTRGGEHNSYNIICRPGDELFAGDIIDAFGEKWLVMEARADKTTHKTGIMRQCNYHVNFQNGTSDIFSRWGFLDISGYSSSFNNNVQLQKGEEQVVIYLPFDEETAKIFVDKRLPSHVGYDEQGEKILFSFTITGVNPVSESYNSKDHLMMLKAVRGLSSPDKDNIDLEICDYIEPELNSDDPSVPVPPKEEGTVPEPKPKCKISGRTNIRIGTTRTYKPVFYDLNGNETRDVAPKWELLKGSEVHMSDAHDYKLSIPDDEKLIGDTMRITLCDANGIYEKASLNVEVIGIG